MWYRRFIVAMIQERKKKELSQGNLQSLHNCSRFLEIPHGLEFLFSGEKNVTELCNDLTMNQSAVSHQLKILRTAKLVHGRREGKSIVYDLADEHVKTIIATGIEHIEE